MNATNEVTGWVVVGTVDGTTEVMSAGHETYEAADDAMRWMKRNATDVSFEIMSACYAAEWVG